MPRPTPEPILISESCKHRSHLNKQNIEEIYRDMRKVLHLTCVISALFIWQTITLSPSSFSDLCDTSFTFMDCAASTDNVTFWDFSDIMLRLYVVCVNNNANSCEKKICFILMLIVLFEINRTQSYVTWDRIDKLKICSFLS